MARAGVDTERVVKVAAELTDSKGFDAVTLKEISEILGVRSPSLYNHISGLPELKEKVSRYAMEMLRDGIAKASIGRSGIDVLKEIGRAYIKFAREHTGLYETIQWLNIGDDVETGSIFSDVVQIAYDIGEEIGEGKLGAAHIVRTVRSLAHGFACIEGHHGFSHPSSVESSYEYALDMFFLGIKSKQDEAEK